MKKLLISLATISLVGGVAVNASAFNQNKHNQKSPQATKMSHSQSLGATNEDVEDIANKLFHKIIKIDPNFLLKKDIHSYQSQFNNAIVQQGIFDASWSSICHLR